MMVLKTTEICTQAALNNFKSIGNPLDLKKIKWK
jgi:hypothetical protein